MRLSLFISVIYVNQYIPVPFYKGNSVFSSLPHWSTSALKPESEPSSCSTSGSFSGVLASTFNRASFVG